jgi:diguanylate cyclase (GGDEF)-like protein/PAS domain S-box-containing protein
MTKGLSSLLNLNPDGLIKVLEDSVSHLDHIVIITNNPNIDKDGLKILSVNSAFCRISGFSKSEVVGLKPSILQGPETSFESVLKIRNAIKNERSIRCEMLNYTKDKEKYWVDLNLTPFSLDGKTCDYFIGYSLEITRYKEARRLALEEKQNLDFVLDSVDLGYWDFDLTTNYVARSLKYDNLFGYKKAQTEWTYQTFLSHIVQEDKNRVDSAFTQAMENGGDYDVEFRCEWPDKSIHWLWSKGRFITDEHNQVLRAVGIQAGIDEKKTYQAKLYNLAYVDELTQLPNRSALKSRLEELISSKAGDDTYCALVFIDLDDFKVVNDTLGHDMGDALLAKIAQRFKQNLPNMDIISRFGGDEFVMLIESSSNDINTAHNKVDTTVSLIRDLFKQPFHCKNQKFYSRVSIGVTLFNDNKNNKFELLQQADLALYHAKACGKNTHRYFNQKLQLDLIKHTNIEKDLRNALINKEFFLVYQPKVSTNSKIVGVEALLRWQHPTKGMISPAEFIPVAEATGLIVPIGEWVLSEALVFIKSWPALGVPPNCTLAINISPVQFKHTLFVQRFTAALKDVKDQVNQLILEITENTFIENLDESLVKINSLKEQGVTFSLDDFGSGFSSLNYLTVLPINEIKIDKSFIDDIVKDKRNTAILTAIIGIATELDLNLVIEGVESIDQVTLLKKLGAEVYQGFYFSKPLGETDLISFVLSHR